MSDSFSIFDNVTVTRNEITLPANEHVTLATSATINNSTGTLANSLKVSVEFSGLPTGIGSFSISSVVESLDENGEWQIVAHQFSDLRHAGQGPKRVMILQPNLDTYNAGIDDSIYVASKEIGRTSRHQGKLPEKNFRVRVLVNDTDPSGPNSFQSVTFSASGEKYNV